MKKTAIIILLLLAAVLLTACGGVGLFTESMYVAEPTPSPAPKFGVQEYYTPEEMEHELQYVEYYHGYGGFEIFLPADWYYEVVEWSEESPEFGLDFWPSGSGDGRLRLRYYDGMFGVCGTGLVEAEGELPGTGKLRVGYYDGMDYPNFIGFYDSPGGWALVNDMGSVWNSHTAEIERILGSLALDPGVIRVSEAETIAQEAIDRSYDYLRTEFDIESGEISVKPFLMGSGGGAIGEVVLDKEGSILWAKNGSEIER